MEGVSFVTVAGLLIGGSLAAPVAAWLVRKVVPEILGVAVGGLIVLTGARTILAYRDVPGALWILGALTVVWALGMAALVAGRRRRALPDGHRHRWKQPDRTCLAVSGYSRVCAIFERQLAGA